MEQDTLNRLKSLSDTELRRLIDEVARASGMKEGVRRAAVAHSGMIRRQLEKAGPGDLQKALNRLGPDVERELRRKLSEGRGGSQPGGSNRGKMGGR